MNPPPIRHQKRRANNAGFINQNPTATQRGRNESNFENEPTGPSWKSVQQNMKRQNELNRRERENIIFSLHQQIIQFQTKLNETIELYNRVELIFRQPDLQTNPHVIHFQTVEKQRIIQFLGDMKFKLQHCFAIYKEVVKNTNTNYHALEKAIELLNPTELNVIFHYLKNLDINLISIYESRKREQIRKFQNTFRSPLKEMGNQERIKETRYLQKQGYPLGLIEAGVAEVSPSVQRHQLLPSTLKKRPTKSNVVRPSSNANANEYPPEFAQRELFPNHENGLRNHPNLNEPPIVPQYLPPPVGLPFSENENEEDPTQPNTPHGGKRQNKKNIK